MMSYLKAVKDRIARFEYFLIEQIPRDLNMQADALANLGSAFHDPSMENIPVGIFWQVLSGSSSTVSAVVPWEQTTILLKGIVSNTSLGYL
ncbi:hypothetical protein OSB04_un001299 [Centaurea solstitialis]|uniref:Uncharacterized protein n=1 Tax=Centaurea solstitialis TaxID=347529 RepID=A0AA38W542_9ASTR|nr:hypothetical protein OSB04_un001299 [Centaurea solstitialis]